MSLVVGEPSPAFSLRNQHGETVSSTALPGRPALVVVFYPFAFSGVCSGELREIRDNLEEFQNNEVRVAAISCDPMHTLRAFSDLEQLHFPLLSDFWPHGTVARRFGVFDEQLGCARRSTFIIDRDGRLAWQVHHQLPLARDISAYRQALTSLEELPLTVE